VTIRFFAENRITFCFLSSQKESKTTRQKRSKAGVLNWGEIYPLRVNIMMLKLQYFVCFYSASEWTKNRG